MYGSSELYRDEPMRPREIHRRHDGPGRPRADSPLSLLAGQISPRAGEAPPATLPHTPRLPPRFGFVRAGQMEGR